MIGVMQATLIASFLGIKFVDAAAAGPQGAKFDFSHHDFPPGKGPKWLVPSPDMPWLYEDTQQNYFPELIKCNDETYEQFALWLNVADNDTKKTYVKDRSGLGEYDVAWSFDILGGEGPAGQDPTTTVTFKQARGFLGNSFQTAYYQYLYANYQVGSQTTNCTVEKAGPQPGDNRS